MDPSTAATVLHSITACGAVVWVAAFAFTRRQARKPADEQLALGGEAPPDYAGSLVVAGSPDELVPRAVGALAVGGRADLGQVKIRQSGTDRVAFDVLGVQSGRVVQTAEPTFHPQGGGRTEVQWSGRAAGGSGLLLGAYIALAVGLLVLVTGSVLLRTFVVASPDPMVRVQVWQMVQCVHFLWPPFLFAGLHRVRGRQVSRWLEVLVHNLPHQRPAP